MVQLEWNQPEGVSHSRHSSRIRVKKKIQNPWIRSWSRIESLAEKSFDLDLNLNRDQDLECLERTTKCPLPTSWVLFSVELAQILLSAGWTSVSIDQIWQSFCGPLLCCVDSRSFRIRCHLSFVAIEDQRDTWEMACRSDSWQLCRQLDLMLLFVFRANNVVWKWTMTPKWNRRTPNTSVKKKQ